IQRPVHGHHFANHIAVTDFQPGFVLRLIRQMLRCSTQYGMRIYLITFANAGITMNNDMRPDYRARTDLNAVLNNGIRAYLYTLSQFCIRRYDSGWVYLQNICVHSHSIDTVMLLKPHNLAG